MIVLTPIFFNYHDTLFVGYFFLLWGEKKGGGGGLLRSWASQWMEEWFVFFPGEVVSYREFVHN